VVQEVERRYVRKLDSEAVIGAIRQACHESMESRPTALCSSSPPAFPRRQWKGPAHLCREHFIQGSLKAVVECVGYSQKLHRKYPSSMDECRPGDTGADTRCKPSEGRRARDVGWESGDMGTEDASKLIRIMRLPLQKEWRVF